MKIYSILLFMATAQWEWAYGAPRQQNTLTAVITNTFPIPVSDPAGIYTGGDTVYIMGGQTGTSTPINDIFTYSISTNTVSSPSRLTVPGSGARALRLGDNGDIFHIGGYSKPSEVLQITPGTWASTSRSFVDRVYSHTCVQVNGTYGICIELWFVYHITLQPWNVEIQNTELNFGSNLGFVKVGEDKIWVLDDGPEFEWGQGIWIYDIPSRTMTKGPTLGNGFLVDDRVQAVYDGTNVWVLNAEDQNGIYQVNPDTYEVTYWEVLNWPGIGWDMYYLFYPVYVDNLRRIYFFGGHTYRFPFDGTSLDLIVYIDLPQGNGTIKGIH